MTVSYLLTEDIEKVELSSYHLIQQHRFLCCIAVARGFFEIGGELYKKDVGDEPLLRLANLVERFVLRDADDVVAKTAGETPDYHALDLARGDLLDLDWGEPIVDPKSKIWWDINRVYIGLITYCVHSDSAGFYSPGQCVDILHMLGFVGLRQLEYSFMAARQSKTFDAANTDPEAKATWRKRHNEIRSLFSAAANEKKSIRIS